MMIRTVTIGFPRVSVVAAQAGRLPRFSFARSSAPQLKLLPESEETCA
jgi:hypothetical protein